MEPDTSILSKYFYTELHSPVCTPSLREDTGIFVKGLACLSIYPNWKPEPLLLFLVLSVQHALNSYSLLTF